MPVFWNHEMFHLSMVGRILLLSRLDNQGRLFHSLWCLLLGHQNKHLSKVR